MDGTRYQPQWNVTDFCPIASSFYDSSIQDSWNASKNIASKLDRFLFFSCMAINVFWADIQCIEAFIRVVGVFFIGSRLLRDCSVIESIQSALSIYCILETWESFIEFSLQRTKKKMTKKEWRWKQTKFFSLFLSFLLRVFPSFFPSDFIVFFLLSPFSFVHLLPVFLSAFFHFSVFIFPFHWRKQKKWKKKNFE